MTRIVGNDHIETAPSRAIATEIKVPIACRWATLHLHPGEVRDLSIKRVELQPTPIARAVVTVRLMRVKVTTLICYLAA